MLRLHEQVTGPVEVTDLEKWQPSRLEANLLLQIGKIHHCIPRKPQITMKRNLNPN